MDKEKKLLKRIIEKQIKQEEDLHWIPFSKYVNNPGKGILFDTNEDNIGTSNRGTAKGY